MNSDACDHIEHFEKALTDELRWQKRYTNGRVPYTMERAAKEIERLRAALLNIQAMAERGNPIDNAKLSAQCQHALNPAPHPRSP